MRHVVPGKVQVLKSTDYTAWTEMPVDYRATANRTMLAVIDEDNMWMATDNGMILKLVTVRNRTMVHASVLSTANSPSSICNSFETRQKKLRKTANKAQKTIDRKRLRAHSDEGSKRFEEQQASGNVADQER